MAASLMDKRTFITTSPYQVPSVDVTQDLPTFSLDTTFKSLFKIVKGTPRYKLYRGALFVLIQ
jgi:hypothetical protein